MVIATCGAVVVIDGNVIAINLDQEAKVQMSPLLLFALESL